MFASLVVVDSWRRHQIICRRYCNGPASVARRAATGCERDNMGALRGRALHLARHLSCGMGIARAGAVTILPNGGVMWEKGRGTCVNCQDDGRMNVMDPLLSIENSLRRAAPQGLPRFSAPGGP